MYFTQTSDGRIVPLNKKRQMVQKYGGTGNHSGMNHGRKEASKFKGTAIGVMAGTGGCFRTWSKKKKAFTSTLRGYAGSTSIHGISYFADASQHFIPR